MNKTYVENEEETVLFAQNIAKNLKKNDVLCLFGDLGVGKTVFSREIVRFLSKNADLEVPSPTFTLVQAYDGVLGPVFHFDLYRLEDPDEVFELGWEDALAEGVVIIEWPEKAGPYLPRAYKAVRLALDADHPDGRHIEVEDVT